MTEPFSDVVAEGAAGVAPRRLSPARIGLADVGGALPTRDLLDLQRCHALARDAVHRPLDLAGVRAGLEGLEVIVVESQAAGREDYLRRPDRGRRLSATSAARLPPGSCDIALILGDGLSPQAVQDHAPALVRRLVGLFAGQALAPIVLALQARVALGDEIGERLGARFAIVLIGERPGLTVTDSLGAYLTWSPRIGRLDSQRNCVSNIRPGGMGVDEAAARIHWIWAEACRLQATGTVLKDGYTPAPMLKDLG